MTHPRMAGVGWSRGRDRPSWSPRRGAGDGVPGARDVGSVGRAAAGAARGDEERDRAGDGAEPEDDPSVREDGGEARLGAGGCGAGRGLGGAGRAAAASGPRGASRGRGQRGGVDAAPRAAARVAGAGRRHAGASAVEGEGAARAPGCGGAVQLAAPLRGRAVRLPRCAATDGASRRVRPGRARRGGLRPPGSGLGSRDEAPARGPRLVGDARLQPAPVRARELLAEGGGISSPGSKRRGSSSAASRRGWCSTT
jgi:hypothetical protein